MTLNSAEIAILIPEMRDRICPGKVEQIHQVSPTDLVWKVRKDGRTESLLVSSHPRHSRLHLLSRAAEAPPRPTDFCRSLRKHLRGGVLTGVDQVPDDRIVRLSFQVNPGRFTFVAEMMGRSSHLLLLDGEEEILACLRPYRGQRRTLVPGQRYAPPEAPRDARPMEVRDFLRDSGEPGLAVESHYARQDLESRAAHLGKILRQVEKKAAGRVRKVRESLDETGRWETWQRKGEALKAAFPSLHRGMKETVVPDPCSGGGETVRIELDPRKTPAENMAACFKKARKLKRGRTALQGRLEEAETLLHEVALARMALLADPSPSHLEELEQWARIRGHLGAPSEPRRKVQPRSGHRRFLSRDGLEIWVGRTDRENDAMTFRAARGEDLFLHVDGRSGSHVIVRMPRGKPVPEETLLDAAELACHYSAAKSLDRAPVIYARRKHVRRTGGGRSGQVSVSQEKRILLQRDPERLRRLLETKDRTQEVHP